MDSAFAEHFAELVRTLGPANLQRLLAVTTPVDVAPQRKLIRDRMPVDSIYFLLEGEVAISIEEHGHQIPLCHLGPGEWLGEVSMLSGELLASSTVTTVTPVRLLRLTHRAFGLLLEDNPELADVMFAQMTATLAERLRVSLAAGATPVSVAGIGQAPGRKSGNRIWALFGASGG